MHTLHGDGLVKLGRAEQRRAGREELAINGMASIVPRPFPLPVFHRFQYHIGSDEMLAVGTAWERGYGTAVSANTAHITGTGNVQLHPQAI